MAMRILEVSQFILNIVTTISLLAASTFLKKIFFKNQVLYR